MSAPRKSNENKCNFSSQILFKIIIRAKNLNKKFLRRDHFEISFLRNKITHSKKHWLCQLMKLLIPINKACNYKSIISCCLIALLWWMYAKSRACKAWNAAVSYFTNEYVYCFAERIPPVPGNQISIVCRVETNDRTWVDTKMHKAHSTYVQHNQHLFLSLYPRFCNFWNGF